MSHLRSLPFPTLPPAPSFSRRSDPAAKHAAQQPLQPPDSTQSELERFRLAFVAFERQYDEADGRGGADMSMWAREHAQSLEAVLRDNPPALAALQHALSSHQPSRLFRFVEAYLSDGAIDWENEE